MYLVIALVGLPAAFRNPTAFALVVAWLVPEILYRFTEDNLPLKIYFIADITIIGVICTKATIKEGCRTYPTIKLQLKCAWEAITSWDCWIAASYIFMVWPVYVSYLHPYYKWWVLWTLVVLQILLAGGEALTHTLGERKRRVMSHPPGGHGLLYAARIRSNG